MKLITKIASGLGAILAAVTALLWWGHTKKREGKKEARSESLEVLNKRSARKRQLDQTANEQNIDELIEDQKKGGFVIKEKK